VRAKEGQTGQPSNTLRLRRCVIEGKKWNSRAVEFVIVTLRHTHGRDAQSTLVSMVVP